jgi:hypothetical protein
MAIRIEFDDEKIKKQLWLEGIYPEVMMPPPNHPNPILLYFRESDYFIRFCGADSGLIWVHLDQPDRRDWAIVEEILRRLFKGCTAILPFEYAMNSRN